MKSLDLSCYALGVSVAVTLLAGCGGPQETGPPRSQYIPNINRVRNAQDRSASYAVLYNFTGGTDGGKPNAGLIDVNGELYGTTSSGGAHFNGTVFSITKGGVEKVLHRFGGYPVDGADPNAELIDVDGALYGTTSSGGAYRNGTVFSISKRGIEKVLHNFGGYPIDGASPNAALVDVNGMLYGTTSSGGAIGSGTVFRITQSGADKVLYSFNGQLYDGIDPEAGLMDKKGTLYGTTVADNIGPGGCCGTIFKITTGGQEKVLHFFWPNGDGWTPSARLLDVKGSFYGTTSSGGAIGSGTVFRITQSGAEKVLYSFNGQPYDGAYPRADLINVRGTLYGTTESGGAYGKGTIFKMSLNGSNEMVLHSFGDGSDGATPLAGLVDVNGTLYGTTSSGGNYNNGTVFVLTP